MGCDPRPGALSAAPVVLASTSPRRAAVLRMLGLDFASAPPDIEEFVQFGESPRDYAERLSLEKALAVAPAHPDALVVAGDTIVQLGDRVFEKPLDEADAAAMLRALSGRTHRVWSGLALAWRGKAASRVAAADVTFRSLDRRFIHLYVETGEPLDKAGAYGIQGCGASMVESVRGDYYAVVGLPVAAFVELAAEIGLDYMPGWGMLRRDREAVRR